MVRAFFEILSWHSPGEIEENLWIPESGWPVEGLELQYLPLLEKFVIRLNHESWVNYQNVHIQDCVLFLFHANVVKHIIIMIHNTKLITAITFQLVSVIMIFFSYESITSPLIPSKFFKLIVYTKSYTTLQPDQSVILKFPFSFFS